MCECPTRMEQPCPGALTHKEELLLLLSRSGMGEKEKRISRETRGEPRAAAITLLRNQSSCWGLSPQNLSGSELPKSQTHPGPKSSFGTPKNPAHTRTQPWTPLRVGDAPGAPHTNPFIPAPPVPAGTLPTHLEHSPTGGIVSLGVPVPPGAAGGAAPGSPAPPHPCGSHGQIGALAEPRLAAGLIRLIKCN